MITPSFNLTATERVLPKLALDFTTASLDPRVTFTRAGATATVVDSVGHVVAAGVDVPRFDYDPVTLACKGLLIEESRTNLCLYSEDFSTSWTNNLEVLTSEAVTAPDGSASVYKIAASSTAGQHYTQKTITVSSGAAYSGSVFLKAAGLTKVEVKTFQSSSPFTSHGSVDVNLTDGSIIGGSGEVEAFPDGWYRINVTGTSTSTGENLRIWLLDSSGSAAFTGNDVDGVYIWGAQLELGAFATSYIPTTTAQVTRNADVATMTGTNFSDWFNASEGTFVVKTGTLNGSSASGFSVDNGTSSNQIIVPYNNSKCFVVLNGGAVQVNAGGSIASGNCSVIYKANDFYTARNAGGADTDTSGTVPTVSQLGIGCRPYGPSFFANGCIQQIDYWPMRLLNAEGLAISK